MLTSCSRSVEVVVDSVRHKDCRRSIAKPAEQVKCPGWRPPFTSSSPTSSRADTSCYCPRSGGAAQKATAASAPKRSAHVGPPSSGASHHCGSVRAVEEMLHVFKIVVGGMCLEVAWVSFDQHVGARDQCRRQRQAELLCSLAIDTELEFSRLLHRQVGGFAAL